MRAREQESERELGRNIDQCPVVGEFGEILENVFIDFSRLFESIEEVWLNEQLDILREVVGWQSSVR